MGGYKDFSKMPVWQKAFRLFQLVFAIAKRLPKEYKYGLANQLIDAGISVPGNIAEGFGRRHSKDKNQFYTISRASNMEIRSHTLCVEAMGECTAEERKEIIDLSEDIQWDLNSIIQSLDRSISKATTRKDQ